MAYVANPTGEDVKQLFADAGFKVCDSDADWDGKAAAALREWERLTGYRPFLEGESASFYYDPPGPNQKSQNRGGGRVLRLDRGFTAITEVKTWITATDPAGTVRTAVVDYRTKPYNAAQDGEPITSIEFSYSLSGEPASVKVTGTPGYAAEWPADAFQAVVELAGASIMKSIREAISGKLAEWKEDDVSERYSVELVQKLGSGWENSGRRTLASYVRY